MKRSIRIILNVAVAVTLAATTEVHGQSGIIWTNVANITITGDVLEKTTAQSTWNAGAISQQSFLADGAVEFKFLAPRYLRIGLAPYNTSTDPTYIPYALLSHINGYAYVYENGVRLAYRVTYTSNDVLSVERSNGVIRYKKNGNTFYTSTLPSSGPLHADCSFSEYHSIVEVTKFTLPLTWTGALNQDWNQAQNWSQNRIPNANDLVVINACTVCPSLNNDITVAGIQLNAGSKIILDTYRLMVNEVTTIIGSTIESSSGKIASKDFIDIKNSAFRGKIILEKSGGTDNNCYGGNTFAPEIQMINSSGYSLQLSSQASNVITSL